MPRFSADQLRKLGLVILERLGAPRDHAELVINTLVDANLVGHDSHGIYYIVTYAERIRKGIIDPKSLPEIVEESPTTAIIDGHWGFGQATARKTIEVAIEKARNMGISAVGAFNCNHIGRLGAYTMIAAENSMIGILMANVTHSVVQPYGGASRVFGSNPISVAIPAEEMKPFLLDFATSAAAESRIRLAAICGEKIPLGWIVDKDGRDTDDPNNYSASTTTVENNGRLLSFGGRDGHKGYCLSVLMEILGGILTGAGSIIDGEQVHHGNGLMAIVLDVQRFADRQQFKKKIDTLIQVIHEKPVDPRFEYAQLQVPGEFEWRNREKRLRDGIDLPDLVWEQIVNLGQELGVDVKNLPPE